MNPILNDPTVKKYFACKSCVACQDRGACNAMALDVLDAMCAPIKEGDRVLSLVRAGVSAKLETAEYTWTLDVHPLYLRLPDAFQEPDYEKELAACLATVGSHNIDSLVDLARKAERQKMEKERR